MSNKLGGKQGTAYLGTNANQPPNWVFSDRDPNQYDVNNVSLGDLWLNQVDESAWILVSLAGDVGSRGSLATWVSLANDGQGALSTLTANTGGVIPGDNNGNINVVGDGVGITITGDPVTHTLTASLVGGGIAAQSFDADSGSALPVAGVVNVIANNAGLNSGSSVSITGSGNTLTLNVTDLSDNTIIGRNSGSLTMTGGDNVILGESSGISLTSGSDNTIIGGTSANALSSGSNNIVLGSGAGSGLTTTDSNNTLIGNVGFIGANEFIAIATGANGTPIFHNYPGVDASTTNGGNIFIGGNAGNFSLAGGPGNASNTGVGVGSLQMLTSGARNNSMGAFALNSITSGSNNTAIGHSAGFDSANSTGLLTGSYNTLIGYAAGDSYTGSESSNIIIGGAAGVVGESNTLRIGENTGTGNEELNKSFIHGIRGITPTINDGIPVFINSIGQLGTVGTGGTSFIQTATGNSGGAVGPSAGNINIVGDGTTATVVGNPGTNTLTITALGGGGGTLTILAGDTGSATPSLGTINIITDNASQAAGASVLFTGSSNNITLSVSDADDNTLMGNASGNATLTGTKNTAFGVLTGSGITTGLNNSMVGYGAGNAFTTGSYNSFLGYLAGSSYTTSESSNITINATGTIAESNVLRIGAGTGTGNAQINKAFISGIRGVTPDTANGIPVFIGSAGQLGTVGNGGTTMVQTVTGNSGGAVGPAAGNINIVGDGTTATVVGNPGTNILTITALGGGGGGDLSVLAGDIGSATPVAGIISIVTGNATQDAGSSVIFNAGADVVALEVTDASNNTLIGFETGKASITGTNNTALGVQCARALTTGASNVFMGVQCGQLVTTGSNNLIIGDATESTILRGSTTLNGFYGFGIGTSVFMHNYGGIASGNTFIGAGTANNFDAGQQSSARNNTACGANSLSFLTTGTENTSLGVGTAQIDSGSFNTLIGSLAGSSYIANESSNICIGRATFGTQGESNTLRIGAGTGTSSGRINKTFISGIRGITTGISNAIPVVIDSNGQLGTGGGASIITTLTGNSGGAVSATGGNVNVRGDGTYITIAGNPGTSTLTASATGLLVKTVTGNSGGAVPALGGNLTIRGDGTSVNVVGNPGMNTLTISATGGAGGPGFFAYRTNLISFLSSSIITYDTAPYNDGSAYNLGTGTFTAPVTGRYNFSFGILIASNGMSSSIPWYAQVITTSRTFGFVVTAPVKGGSTSPKQNFSIGGNNFYTNMTAGDTVYITLTSSPFPNTASCDLVGISGDLPYIPMTGIVNYFSGTLI